MTYAKIIADSTTEWGDRVTTFEVQFHRFVLAEFNTHCVLSRNSASSRAIPLRKQLKRVRERAAVPVSWPREQKGMQGGDELDSAEVEIARRHWLDAAEKAATTAEALGLMNIHKSVANRLLEPFMWHTVVCTGTAWHNFFEQRCSPLAQPEIREVALLMRDAYDESKPRQLDKGEWHLPYVDHQDELWARDQTIGVERKARILLAKVSAARCARVSYLTQDGKRDHAEDLGLFDRLVTARPAHWSPLEHVATPWATNRQGAHLSFLDLDCRVVNAPTSHLPRIGKLLGWRTLRTTVETMQNTITYC